MRKDNSTSVYFDRLKHSFIGLEKAHIEHLKELFKGVDIDHELKKMSLWLTTTPQGKKRKGTMGFILNWLKNASRSAVYVKPEFSDTIKQDTPLRPFVNNYLKELWKGKEHILEFNKIK